MKRIEFKGGIKLAFLPIIIFFIFCILYFVVFQAFDITALATGAFVGLLAGSLMVKKDSYDAYWQAATTEAKEVVPLAFILFVIGIFSEMMKASQLSSAFVYLADFIGINGGIFTAFTFFAVCMISVATGSSIGTIFTTFPLFYPAGVLLGANPIFMAGAVISGGVFGDNIAPISDLTIISTGSQFFSRGPRAGQAADIPGAVVSRIRYALVAGLIACLAFAFLGNYSSGNLTHAHQLLEAAMDPKPLVMLIPIIVMIGVSIYTNNIFKAVTVGLILGSTVGLVSGVLSPADILAVEDGESAGFLIRGIANTMPTVTLIMGVYGITGILVQAGVMEALTHRILSSKYSQSVRGTELILALGISLTTLLFGGVNSASIAAFGKVYNEVGQRIGLHPYRRSNMLDGMANSLVMTVPFLSVHVSIGMMLSYGYDFVAPLSPFAIGRGMLYQYIYFAVLLYSMLSGKGRSFEGPNGEEVSERPPSQPSTLEAS